MRVNFHFKISWLASYLAVQGNPERKQREKTLRGSGEIAKKTKD